MDQAFARYLEALHPSFERLIAMPPVSVANLPRKLPSKCVYLFSEQSRSMYVGRTKHLRNRLRQHSTPAAQHNQAVFAFKLAREKTGHKEAAYKKQGSRGALSTEPVFAKAFSEAKARVRNMELRFVEETDPLRQSLLEIYVAVVLKTSYNDFDTH